jgi:hypothetical protein
MLLDEPGQQALATLRREPRPDPLDNPAPQLAPLQQWALARLADRFALRPVAEGDGFTVVELRRRG